MVASFGQDVPLVAQVCFIHEDTRACAPSKVVRDDRTFWSSPRDEDVQKRFEKKWLDTMASYRYGIASNARLMNELRRKLEDQWEKSVHLFLAFAETCLSQMLMNDREKDDDDDAFYCIVPPPPENTRSEKDESLLNEKKADDETFTRKTVSLPTIKDPRIGAWLQNVHPLSRSFCVKLIHLVIIAERSHAIFPRNVVELMAIFGRPFQSMYDGWSPRDTIVRRISRSTVMIPNQQPTVNMFVNIEGMFERTTNDSDDDVFGTDIVEGCTGMITCGLDEIKDESLDFDGMLGRTIRSVRIPCAVDSDEDAEITRCIEIKNQNFDLLPPTAYRMIVRRGKQSPDITQYSTTTSWYGAHTGVRGSSRCDMPLIIKTVMSNIHKTDPRQTSKTVITIRVKSFHDVVRVVNDEFPCADSNALAREEYDCVRYEGTMRTLSNGSPISNDMKYTAWYSFDMPGEFVKSEFLMETTQCRTTNTMVSQHLKPEFGDWTKRMNDVLRNGPSVVNEEDMRKVLVDKICEYMNVLSGGVLKESHLELTRKGYMNMPLSTLKLCVGSMKMQARKKVEQSKARERARDGGAGQMRQEYMNRLRDLLQKKFELVRKIQIHCENDEVLNVDTVVNASIDAFQRLSFADLEEKLKDTQSELERTQASWDKINPNPEN